MKRFFLLVLLFVFRFSQGQTWQNITPQKGAYALSGIKMDTKGNLYVFCPPGVFVSKDKGTTWAKLGKDIIDAIKLIDPHLDLRNGDAYDLFLLGDTVNVFLEKSDNSYSGIFYDRNCDCWKLSGKVLSTRTDPRSAVQTKGNVVATLESANSGPDTRQVLNYSKDGMKTWKTSPRNFDAYAEIYAVGNTLWVFGHDTLFGTKDGTIFSFHLIPDRFSWKYAVANEKMKRYNITYPTIDDSLLIQEWDTLAFQWKKTSSVLLPSSFQIHSTSSLSITQGGTIIAPFNENTFCEDGLQLSKDGGKTWDTLRLKADEDYRNPTIPFVELYDQLYFASSYVLLQRNSISQPLLFEYVDPNGFGFQGMGEETIEASENFIGNHLSIGFCFKDTLQKRQRWDGTSWRYLPPLQLPDVYAGGPSMGTSRYYIKHFNDYFVVTKDEGIIFDSLPSPIPDATLLNITEMGGIFYAVIKNKIADTLFFTTDLGKNWVVKKTPSSLLTGLASGNSRLDMKGDTLYLIQNVGTSKKILASHDQANTWEDITFNIPQDIPFYNDDSYNDVIDNNTNATVVALNKNNTYRYQMYKLNKRTQSWDFQDSMAYYFNTSFQIDTSLRMRVGEEGLIYELRMNDQNWKDMNPAIAQIQKGDTILMDFPGLAYNSKGLYAITNYGLFYSPYPHLVTNNEQKEISPSSQGQYVIFPNPTEQSIQIVTSEEKIDYQLTDLAGRSFDVQNKWDTGNAIQVKHLENGVYLLKIKGDNEEGVFKFIKR